MPVAYILSDALALDVRDDHLLALFCAATGACPELLELWAHADPTCSQPSQGDPVQDG